ncbi:MAG: DUF805 domain-containing protein [Propionibacteriaceae bacterium]|nr:DUF805 domain-containing protein [Propionibacteriaceae bacterium]
MSQPTPGQNQFYDQNASQPAAAPTHAYPQQTDSFMPPVQPQFGNPTPTDPGLDQPWYGIGFIPAVKRAFQKYATFNGRASRGEYWWFWLGTIIVGVILGLLTIPGIDWGTYLDAVYSGYTGDAPINAFGIIVAVVSFLWGLAIIIPTLALTWRRLHDTNRSGGWFFITLIPFVGPIILIVFLATATYTGPTRWDR